MRESQEVWRERLNKEVLEYTAKHFVLQNDLRHLAIVIGAGAPEAIVFYSTRILEALAGEALSKVGQSASANLFSNLQILEQLNRVATAQLYWAHALRRLGNAVRHLQGSIGLNDAALSVLFAERWLYWFFCQFSHGHRLPGLTSDGSTLALSSDQELHFIVRALEAVESCGVDRQSCPPANLEESPGFFNTPTLPAVLTEILLSSNEEERAFHVLNAARSRFPDDLRLRQLTGLWYSRAKKLPQALEWMEPLYLQFPDDDETAGIIAGIYKRRWRTNRSNLADLEKAHRVYRNAWKKSARKNVYVGINTATTALWLGLREDSRRIAREVEEALQRRFAGLPEDLRDPSPDFSFWDQVALAEAQLLLGQREQADRNYDSAFNRHAGRKSDIDVARTQRDEILAALGPAHECLPGPC